MVQMFGWFKGFTLEASESLCVLGYVVRQELEGYESVQPGVFGLVDHTHTATAEPLDDAVVGDGLTDHWAAMLGLKAVQVNERVEVRRVYE